MSEGCKTRVVVMQAKHGEWVVSRCVKEHASIGAKREHKMKENGWRGKNQ